jgi:two-component system, cell cycle sensor histidine kinase and response regulator CckA
MTNLRPLNLPNRVRTPLRPTHAGHRSMSTGFLPGGSTAGGARDELEPFFRSSLDLLCIATLEGRFLRLSPGWQETLGYPTADLLGRRAEELIHPDDMEAARESAAELRRTGFAHTHRVRYRHRDGSFRWLDWRARLVDGRIYASACDVTRYVELQESLEQKELENRLLFLAAPQPMWVFDRDTLQFLAVNDAAVARYGWSREEFLAMTILEIRPSDEVPRLRAAISGNSDRGRTEAGIWTHRTRDGEFLEVEITSHPLEFQGRPARMVLSQDVTARLEGDRWLRLQGEALRVAANAIVIAGSDGVIQWTNPAFQRMTGFAPEEAVGRTPGELLRSGVHGPAFYRNLWSTIRSGRVWQGEMVNRRKDGSQYTEEQTITPVTDGAGTITHFVAIKQDVTERRKVAEALRRSEARYHGLFRDSPAVMMLVDPKDETIVEGNPAAARYYGLPLEGLAGMPLSRIEGTSSPRGEGTPDEGLGERGGTGGGAMGPRHWEGPGDGTPRRTRHRVAGGEDREVEVYSGPVEVEGRPLLHVLIHDVTDRIRAEAQLRQAQKMESVGRLAGGVAHDFNNVLTVINAVAEFAAGELDPESPLQGELAEIREAGARAANLTRQLLTLSRQEIARRRRVDLNEVVDGMDRLLRRVLGEDVRVRYRPEPGLPQVEADPGHLEQVIMNLAVNARDAMPDGGSLIIETHAVEVDPEARAIYPTLALGPHVVLSVTDTGTGMDRDTQERIFEPFFSTKPPDRGTGLGLSTVYGIVRESGGQITVYSEPNQGSTFRVYLPALEWAPETGRRLDVPGVELGSERVLLVEDDDAVRSVTARVLRSAGYAVVEAADGPEALECFRADGVEVDLVLTDLVMPGMSGLELAEVIATERPDVKLLFTSGHTSDALARRKLDERELHFVGKPFTAAELTRGVRAALGD